MPLASISTRRVWPRVLASAFVGLALLWSQVLLADTQGAVHLQGAPSAWVQAPAACFDESSWLSLGDGVLASGLSHGAGAMHVGGMPMLCAAMPEGTPTFGEPPDEPPDIDIPHIEHGGMTSLERREAVCLCQTRAGAQGPSAALLLGAVAVLLCWRRLR